ncbi:MAG: FAD-dependent thymidylate synthase [Clostridiales bacterium]|uniref:FAD-dependent thymidylate synthase n=1 Tax=Terrisporobacter sp. TaxID=1965305 RepID=UPI002A4FADD3|nr:FAD-dependent thymidylate synthase [Terrisporobacter sp.]MDD7753398.1 FAD-dependent thymidylate synthase [Clostridiales bacterium]MDY4134790.1 FAD-dependent thymidylate synthase [Terrisporobacter sp.]
MKIIPSSVQILDNDWSIKGIFRAVERAGRTCYKSIGTRYFRLPEGPKNSLESNLIKQAQSDVRVVCKKGADFDPAYYLSIPNKFIGDYLNIEQFNEETFEDSPYYENLTAEDFVNMLIKSGHGAMLEHGTVYLAITYDPENIEDRKLLSKYWKNSYTKVISKILESPDLSKSLSEQKIGESIKVTKAIAYITSNLRVLVENNWLDDLKYVCEPTEYHAKRVMVRFICDRGVSHEIVRHRVMSFAQESTRYCNYSKDKFGQELTFIEPSWEFPSFNIVNTRERFEAMLGEAEANYMELITLGFKPQEARAVLPNALKTEIVVTGFIDDWKHFFELRCSNAAHPDIRKLALDLQNQFIDRNFI